jgi:hypothetical protein
MGAAVAQQIHPPSVNYGVQALLEVNPKDFTLEQSKA